MTRRSQEALANRPSKHAHKLVAETAKALAHELYDVVMSDNRVFSEWKRQNPEVSRKELERRFVERNWGKCLQAARTTLALMLRGSCPDELKDTIHEALVLDGSLIRGRGGIRA